ncbi:MAG: FeoB small GTPase domain-containing protein, partial [Acidobacteriota bacterium]
MAVLEECRTRKLVLVGNPNVGKSVIFRLITGSYVMVSNFPGTTVDVSRGKAQIGGVPWEVIDTPGINSMVPQSEDERVTCEILLEEAPDLIVQVADAKNLRRTLLVTSQLVEFQRPMVLVMNMMDEAHSRGIQIDTAGLSQLLNIPVVETVAIYSQGKKQLFQAIQSASVPRNPVKLNGWVNPEPDESKAESPIPRALGVEWLSLEDRGFTQWLTSFAGPDAVEGIARGANGNHRPHGRGLAREIAAARNEFLEQAVER